MNVGNFFKFIADRKPEYPLGEWGPKIMKNTIKHLEPVRGQSTIDNENLKVTGKFEYIKDYYEVHALFGDDGSLKYSYVELDIHLYGGMSQIQSIYMTSIQNLTNQDSRNVLWRAFKVLSDKNIKLEKDFDFYDYGGSGDGLFDIDSVRFNQNPTELYSLIRNQFSKLTEDQLNFIKENDNIDVKSFLNNNGFLNNNEDDYVFMRVLSSAGYNRQGYPDSITSLYDYVNNLLHCCAQYEADDVNSMWFDGTAPTSFDSYNNVESVDASRFPIVRWNLSGNMYLIHYNYDKQLLSPEDIVGGYQSQNYKTKGLDDDLINHYMRIYPFQG